MLVLGSHYLHIQFTHFLYTVCMHIRTYVRMCVCMCVCFVHDILLQHLHTYVHM